MRVPKPLIGRQYRAYRTGEVFRLEKVDELYVYFTSVKIRLPYFQLDDHILFGINHFPLLFKLIPKSKEVKS